MIFHIDVNSAFLSWEAVYRLEQGGTVDLREIPCAVGGDKTKRRGIILAKSLSAKACGVKTGEPLTEALKKCPSLIVVPAHHSMYRQYSQKFLNILREYSPSVEQYSICLLYTSNNTVSFHRVYRSSKKGEKFMEMLSLTKELKENAYPGRGIVLGKSEDGKKAVAAYFIMGRSENSRNRVFVEDGEGIRTQARCV